MASKMATEGINQVLNAGLHADTSVGTWYIGLVDSTGYTTGPQTGDTAAKITTTANPPTTNAWQEVTAYDEANRVTWSEGAASSGSTTGAGATVFTINATKTIKGAFLVSNSTKGGTSGILLGAGDFSLEKSCEDNDTLAVTCTVSITST